MLVRTSSKKNKTEIIVKDQLTEKCQTAGKTGVTFKWTLMTGDFRGAYCFFQWSAGFCIFLGGIYEQVVLRRCQVVPFLTVNITRTGRLGRKMLFCTAFRKTKTWLMCGGRKFEDWRTRTVSKINVFVVFTSLNKTINEIWDGSFWMQE